MRRGWALAESLQVRRPSAVPRFAVHLIAWYRWLEAMLSTKGTMRQLIVTLVAAAALIGAAPASAHGLVSHPHCKSLQCRETSQTQNLAHARYLCNHGRHATKAWGCQAVKWLTKELNETEAALHPVATSDIDAWSCIHHREGAWNSNTGNGYYGGLQMDMGFQGTYGSEYLHRWGTADNWPAWAQIDAARRARDSGRGYNPWPNTARACGLL